MQNRVDFWTKNWHTGSQPLSIDRPYCKAFNLDTDDLKKINDQIFKIIYSSMDQEARSEVGSSANHEAITEWLNHTKIFFLDVANQLDNYIQLESIVLTAFQKAGFLDSVTAIQLPIDIRIVHPVPPPDYLEKRKAVDFLHTDAWRGEPPDVVNCVLYSVSGPKTSQLVVYDVAKEGIATFEDYDGPEKEAGFLVENLPEVEFSHVPGETVFFDAYSPHNTRRNGDEVRISLNFSFRRDDPYETLDERWDRAQQNWSKYWYLPEKTTGTFEARCDQELQKITQSQRSEALSLRKTAIEKLSTPKRPEEIYAG